MRLEDEVAPVGREALGRLRTRVCGQLAQLAPRGRDEVDIRPLSIAVAGEGDIAAIGRPYGLALIAGGRGQAARFAPRRRDRIDIPLIGKGDLPTIGRDARVAQPQRTLLSCQRSP